MGNKTKRAITNKNTTISVDRDIMDRYIKLCRENGWWVSKQLELFMKRELMKDEAK